MRFTLFVCLLLTCLAFTKAHELRYSKVQDFLKKYPILIKESDMIDIAENESFSMPQREMQRIGTFRPNRPTSGSKGPRSINY